VIAHGRAANVGSKSVYKLGGSWGDRIQQSAVEMWSRCCLLYTSDAADDLLCV